MLIVTTKRNERIELSRQVDGQWVPIGAVIVVKCGRNQIRVGFEMPKDVKVRRADYHRPKEDPACR